MRIGVITTSYPRFAGDPAGSFVAECNDWLMRSGHTLEVVAAGDGCGIDDWQNVPVHRVLAAHGLFYQGGAPDALGQKGYALAAARFSARLAVVIRKRAHRWDGMVAHWLAPSALACAVAAPSKPLWAIAHGGDVHLLRRSRMTAMAGRLLGRRHVHVNFVSHSLRESFSESSGAAVAGLVARSSVASMGVDLEHFRSLQNLRQNNTKPVLLFLGRLVPIKGVDVLLEALVGIAQDWRVIIAGAGPSEGDLKQQARKLGLLPEWPGEVHGDARDALLSQANLVVIPSRPYAGRQEGMPKVALEALAVGAQLLVSDSGGLAEIPQSICHQVPSEDRQALRAAICKVRAGAKAQSSQQWLEQRSWESLGPQIFSGL